MANILLIEDEQGIAFVLNDRLIAEGHQLTHCSDGLEGERAAKVGDYDLILLDVMLPGKDGFQICQDLRADGILTPILMLTARTTTIDTVMGLRLGADDYLAKPFDMQVLIARIDALVRRAATQPNSRRTVQESVSFGAYRLDMQTQQLLHLGSEVSLNAQEYRLLAYLVSHPDRVLSRDELLDAVWGYNSDVTTRTVDVHVAWLRKKIGDHPIPRHILTLRGRGYKFER